MQVWILVGQLLPLDFSPHHESVHGASDPRLLDGLSLANLSAKGRSRIRGSLIVPDVLVRQPVLRHADPRWVVMTPRVVVHVVGYRVVAQRGPLQLLVGFEGVQHVRCLEMTLLEVQLVHGLVLRRYDHLRGVHVVVHRLLGWVRLLLLEQAGTWRRSLMDVVLVGSVVS